MAKYEKVVLRILFVVFVAGIIGGVFFTISLHDHYIDQIPSIWYKTDRIRQINFAVNETRDIAVSGNYAYIADNLYGMDVVNITNPSAPDLIYHAKGYSSQSIAVSDNIAYVGCIGGMKVYNVSDPANPVQTAFYNVTTQQVCEISIYNHIAYITVPSHSSSVNSIPDVNINAVVNIVNITNPLAPILIGSIDCSSKFARVAVSGNILCIADGKTGMRLIDITDKSSPHELSIIQNYGTQPLDYNAEAKDVKIVGNIAYLTDTFSDLVLINISNPSNPIVMDFKFNGGSPNGLTVQNNNAYITRNSGGFVIVNATKMSKPMQVGAYNNTVVTTRISVVKNTVYLIDRNGLEIVHMTEMPGKDYPLPPFNIYPLIGYFGVLGLCTISIFLFIKTPREGQWN